MAGIKKAMRTQAKRDGEKFQDHQITEFKIGDLTLGDLSKTPVKAEATGRR